MQNRLITASYDMKIRCLNLETGNISWEMNLMSSQANRLVYDFAKEELFMCEFDFFSIFDLATNQEKAIASINAHEGNITDILSIPSSIITCGDDKNIKFWDTKAPFSAVSTIKTKEQINCASLMHKDNYYLFGNESGEITYYDSRMMRPVTSIACGNSPVRSVCMAPDKSYYIIALMDGDVIHYTMKSYDFVENYRIRANNDVTTRCVISPDCKLFATAGSENSTKLFDSQDGKLLQDLIANESDDWVWDLSFTADSASLISGGSDGQCRIWDVKSGHILDTIAMSEMCISALTVVP